MTTRADQLRGAFDRGFAAAPPPPDPGRRELLCIRVADEPFAIAVDEVAALHADLRIVALPSRAPELLGVAAIRTAIAAIYDLGLALGVAGGGAPRWAVLLRGAPVGFAFHGFDGHVRVPEDRIAEATRHDHVRGQFNLDGQPRLIVGLGSVLAAIEGRSRGAAAGREP